MAYDNTNSGVLFINKHRNGNAKAPNLKGTGRVTIDGHEYELELAAWTKQSEKAGKFLSLTIKLAASKQAASTQRPPSPPDDADLAW